MSEVLTILNRSSLAEIATTSDVLNPLIYEEINKSYIFTFTTALDGYTQYLKYPNIVEVSGDYFRIARVVRKRDTSVTIDVECEHISYELNDEEEHTDEEAEDYEGTPTSIVSKLLLGTQFTPGLIEFSGSIYFKPRANSIRGKIIELANFLGGELLWDKFTISILTRLGQNNGLEIKLGENIIGVTEEVDTREGIARKAYEIDVIDLAQMPEYDGLTTVNLGDTVRVLDPFLNIDETLRIVSREYNPFRKINPRIQIGHVIRDYTDYIRDVEEEIEEEVEDDGLYLSRFMVGDVDCLKLGNIDETKAVIEYVKDTTLQGVIPLIDCEVAENKQGVQVSLKQKYKDYKLTAIVTYESNTGLASTRFELPNSQLNTVNFPGTVYVSVSLTIVITTVPFSEIFNGNVDVDKTFIQAYGVRFLTNDHADGLLETFKVGTVDCLYLDDIDATEQTRKYLKGEVSYPLASHIYETEYSLNGVYATLKDTYIDYHLTMIHSWRIGENSWSVEHRKMPYANARILTIPTEDEDSIIMAVTKEPFDAIKNGTINVDEAFVYAFGIRVVKTEPTPAEDKHRIEFGAGEVNSEGLAEFEFAEPSDDVESVATGIISEENYQVSEDLTVVTSLMEEGGKYTGVRVKVLGNASGLKIGIQAVCVDKAVNVIG